MGEAIRNPVEIGEGEPFVAGDQGLGLGVQRAEGLEELRKRRREVGDDRAPLLVIADDEPAAGRGELGQDLIELAIQVTGHSPSFAFAATRLMRR